MGRHSNKLAPSMESTYDAAAVGAGKSPSCFHDSSWSTESHSPPLRQGWFGLAAAKAYLEQHSDSKMAIIESSESWGGTWSMNRLYPGLKSDNMIGTYEYLDFPTNEARHGGKTDEPHSCRRIASLPHGVCEALWSLQANLLRCHG